MILSLINQQRMYRTGDLARWRRDGSIELPAGYDPREDSRHRSLREIESAILQKPERQVKQACGCDANRQRIKRPWSRILFQPKASSRWSHARLIARIAAHYSGHSLWRFRFCRVPTGKD